MDFVSQLAVRCRLTREIRDDRLGVGIRMRWIVKRYGTGIRFQYALFEVAKPILGDGRLESLVHRFTDPPTGVTAFAISDDDPLEAVELACVCSGLPFGLKLPFGVRTVIRVSMM